MRDKNGLREQINKNDRGSRNADKSKIGGVSVLRAFTPYIGSKSSRHDQPMKFKCCKGAVLLGDDESGNCSACGKFFYFNVSEDLHDAI